MVVLTSGSMRMAVESVDDETVNVVWCHEGKVGRDAFSEKLLNKWEMRDDSRGPRPSFNDRGPRQGGFGGGDRNDRGPRPGGFGGGDRGNDRGDRAPRPFADKGGDRGPRAGGWNNDKGGDRPQGGDRGDRPQGGGWNKDRAPAGPSTYDGRPREKKFFRKDS